MILAFLLVVPSSALATEPCAPHEAIYVDAALDPATRPADRPHTYRIGPVGSGATLPQLLSHTGHAQRARRIRRSAWLRRVLAGAGIGLLGAGALSTLEGDGPTVGTIAWTAGTVSLLAIPAVGRRARRLPRGELARIVDGHNRELLAACLRTRAAAR